MYVALPCSIAAPLPSMPCASSCKPKEPLAFEVLGYSIQPCKHLHKAIFVSPILFWRVAENGMPVIGSSVVELGS